MANKIINNNNCESINNNDQGVLEKQIQIRVCIILANNERIEEYGI